MKLIEHFIDGKKFSGDSKKTGKIYNPAIGEQSSEVKLGTAKDLDKAVESAKKAFESWSNKPPIQRILNEADAFWIRGNLDQTNLQLERALRISKNEGPIYLRLAHLRIEQGLNKEAKAFAAKGLLINNLSNWERLLLNLYFQHDNS